MEPLRDSWEREIKSVRVSVTDKCNFRCTYCMPAEGLEWLGRAEVLSFEEIERLVRVLAGLGLVTLVIGVDLALAWRETSPLYVLGAVLLAVFLLRGRAPATYAGVFAVVAALELYGTALGTWRWAEVAPGTSITQGNPPSGIASGYVFFDIAALALAPVVLALTRRARRSRGATQRI